MNGATKYLMCRLGCGYNDLQMLDNLYSNLVFSINKDSEATIYEIIDNHTSLNDLLSTIYTDIQFAIAWEILKTSKSRYTQEKAKAIALNPTVYANYIDTHFCEDIEQIIDWEVDVKANAKALRKYWLRQRYDYIEQRI